jgi:hypothetical protein
MLLKQSAAWLIRNERSHGLLRHRTESTQQQVRRQPGICQRLTVVVHAEAASQKPRIWIGDQMRRTARFGQEGQKSATAFITGKYSERGNGQRGWEGSDAKPGRATGNCMLVKQPVQAHGFGSRQGYASVHRRPRGRPLAAAVYCRMSAYANIWIMTIYASTRAHYSRF